MKRELKGCSMVTRPTQRTRFRPHPYEEGTERRREMMGLGRYERFRPHGCDFAVMYLQAAYRSTFFQKQSHWFESLIARKWRMGAAVSRFQRMPLRQKRALISSLHPASVTPLPIGSPAAR